MKNKQVFLATTYQKENRSGILCSVLENGIPIEFSLEPLENPSLVGNIYIGKVKNLSPQINAAFIEIQPGLICYYSLDENQDPILVNRRHTATKKKLSEGDELIVQVTRDAMKTKAPTVSSNLNFTGRYLVLTSQNHRIGVSSKLAEEERHALKTYLSSLWDGSYGLIARTNAVDADKQQLCQELERLQAQYHSVLDKARTRTCYSSIYHPEPTFLQTLRDFPGGIPDQIITDDSNLYQILYAYLSEFQPESLPCLTMHSDQFSSLQILYSLEKHLDEALKERVWLKSGGYLVIQPTEALTVIDVNTGKFEGGKQKQHTFLKINREAAVETARQLRLRNLSGIIIVDFIDMTSQEDRETLMELFRQELKKDPVKTTLVDMTKLYLMEITRKKIKKSLQEQYNTF